MTGFVQANGYSRAFIFKIIEKDRHGNVMISYHRQRSDMERLAA
jgi:hypothetical protein